MRPINSSYEESEPTCFGEPMKPGSFIKPTDPTDGWSGPLGSVGYGRGRAPTADSEAREQKPAVKTRDDFSDDEEYIDHLAEQIDVYDILTIINFGEEPSKKLADKAREVRQATKADTDLIAKFDQLAQAIRSGDFHTIKDVAQDYKLALQKKGNWLTQCWNQMRGSGASQIRRKFERQTQGIINQVDTTIGDLQQVQKRLPKHIKRFQELENAVVKNQKEVDFHITALDRVISKIREELIPELEGKVENGQADADDKHKLRKLRNTSLARLEAAREAFIAGDGVKEIVLSQIDDQRDVYATLAVRTREHLTHSRALWEIQGAAAQGVVSTSRMISSVEEADALTPKMLKQTKALSAMTHEDAKRLMQTSLIDPDSLIEMLESMGDEIQETNSILSHEANSFGDRASRVKAAISDFKNKRDLVKLPTQRTENDSENTEAVAQAHPSLSL